MGGIEIYFTITHEMSETTAEHSVRDNAAALDAVLDATLKHDSTWLKEMAAKGYKVLFFGSDIDRFNTGKKISKTDEVYLAMSFECDKPDQIANPPLWDKFCEQLKDWEWQNESRRDIRLKDSGIVLNVSAYSMETPCADVSRLSREKENTSGDSERGNRQIRVIAYGAERAEVFSCSIRDGYLCIIVFFENTPGIYQFQE